MTTEELIRILGDFPPNALVGAGFSGLNGHVNEVIAVRLAKHTGEPNEADQVEPNELVVYLDMQEETLTTEEMDIEDL